MEPEKRALLEQHMEAMARGDGAFLVSFLKHFGNEIERVVGGIVGGMGRRDILSDRDEIEGLVVDVAFIIFDTAANWSADGALPWVYARRAIEAHISTAVGHARGGSVEDLESEVSDAPNPGVVDLGVEYLVLLSHSDPRIRLALDALAEAAPERCGTVFLEYQLQRLARDPSPSHTVAMLSGLSRANVRQIKCRVRRNLQPVLAQARYAAIAELPLLVA
ncbi:MAG: hypothetical protein ACC660_01255 [Acidimicrobiales bacterium]